MVAEWQIDFCIDFCRLISGASRFVDQEHCKLGYKQLD